MSAACFSLRAADEELHDESIEYVAALVIDSIRGQRWTYAQIAADPAGAVAALRALQHEQAAAASMARRERKVAHIDALVAAIYSIDEQWSNEMYDTIVDFERIEDLAEMPWSDDQHLIIKAGLQDMQINGFDIPGTLVERFDISIV